MSQDIEVNGGGLGFCSLLTILFIGLKLFGSITWSWWWVLSPLWIPFAIVAAITGIALAVFGCIWAYEKMTEVAEK